MPLHKLGALLQGFHLVTVMSGYSFHTSHLKKTKLVSQTIRTLAGEEQTAPHPQFYSK